LGFVSYLWGIETTATSVPAGPVGSLYLTYEGLKPPTAFPYWRKRIGLYLTYEGLKLVRKGIPLRTDAESLYLTYEGLKLQWWNAPFFGHSGVCILPMRDWNGATISGFPGPASPFVSYLWGIETCKVYERRANDFPVCILPMRDWNNIFFVLCINQINRFVSYLWGIETVNDNCTNHFFV